MYQVRRDALVQTKAILGIDEDFFLGAENCIPGLAIDCLYSRFVQPIDTGGAAGSIMAKS